MNISNFIDVIDQARREALSDCIWHFIGSDNHRTERDRLNLTRLFGVAAGGNTEGCRAKGLVRGFDYGLRDT